jgi:hypothetical protein
MMTPTDFASLTHGRLAESPYLVHPVLRDLAMGRYPQDAVRAVVVHLAPLVRRQPIILSGAIASMTPQEQAELSLLAEDPSARQTAFEQMCRLLGLSPAVFRQTLVLPELDGYLLSLGSVALYGPLVKALGALWAVEMQTGAENPLLIEAMRRHPALSGIDVGAALPAPSGCSHALAEAVGRHVGDDLSRKLVIEGTDLVLRLRYNVWQAVQQDLQSTIERFSPAALWTADCLR